MTPQTADTDSVIAATQWPHEIEGTEKLCSDTVCSFRCQAAEGRR